MSDTQTPQAEPTPVMEPAPMPVAQWERVKAWVRRELELHGAGLSHEERSAENP